MKRFYDFLSGFGTLSDASLEILAAGLKEEVLKKDQYALQAGEVCNKICFILEGVARCYYCDRNGNEFTRYLLQEGHFVVNLYSYNDGVPSSEYLEAVTDCKLAVMERKVMDSFYQQIPEWTAMMKSITEKALLGKMELKNMLLSSDGVTKYLYFVEHYPGLMQRVPLGYIASFLGLTQSSLSRIRKKVSKGDFLPYDKKIVEVK